MSLLKNAARETCWERGRFAISATNECLETGFKFHNEKDTH
jgi:hypothetical protein